MVPVGDALREAILTRMASTVMAPVVAPVDSTKLVVRAVLALSELLKLVASMVAHVVLVVQFVLAVAHRVATVYPIRRSALLLLFVGIVRVNVPADTETVPPNDPT